MTVLANFGNKEHVPHPQTERPVMHGNAEEKLTCEEIQADLNELIAELDALPHNPNWPPDGAKQLDHYLYGLPKRP